MYRFFCATRFCLPLFFACLGACTRGYKYGPREIQIDYMISGSGAGTVKISLLGWVGVANSEMKPEELYLGEHSVISASDWARDFAKEALDEKLKETTFTLSAHSVLRGYWDFNKSYMKYSPLLLPIGHVDEEQWFIDISFSGKFDNPKAGLSLLAGKNSRVNRADGRLTVQISEVDLAADFKQSISVKLKYEGMALETNAPLNDQKSSTMQWDDRAIRQKGIRFVIANAMDKI